MKKCISSHLPAAVNMWYMVNYAPAGALLHLCSGLLPAIDGGVGFNFCKLWDRSPVFKTILADFSVHF